MNQDPNTAVAAELLSRLKDIHGVAEPSWWPPAPGWWLLAALVAAAFAYALTRLAARWRVHRRRRRLLEFLDGLDAKHDPDSEGADYLAELNRLIRAVALRAFPETPCARLEGRQWVQFIHERLPEGSESACLEALEDGPYRPRPEFDPAALQAAVRRWVLAHG